MGIANYIRTIGRGSRGARAIDRAQAADLFGQLLDGTVTDLEVGAFCLAMRIKGETPEEMAGFLDATAARLRRVPAGEGIAVVLPSYNGARRLPVLTPLLGMLLARAGARVLMHGAATESGRVTSGQVLDRLGVRADEVPTAPRPGELRFVPTAVLCPGLHRLLEVRRTVGVRNSAHALVKLMNPCDGDALVVASYTHADYAVSMAETLELTGGRALLLRGTEGEPVADPRRTPRMESFVQGRRECVQPAQGGALAEVPGLPAVDPDATAEWTRAVLAGDAPVPSPIALQVERILHAVRA